MSATFLDAIDRIAGERIALEDETETVSYLQLRDEAQRIATLLRQRYGGNGHLILPAASTARFVVTFVGMMYGGFVPVPVDPGLTAPQLDYVKAKSRALALVSSIPRDQLSAVKASDHRNATLPALVLFTSGTSGAPKGVVVSQTNLSHSCTVISRYLEYQRYPSAAVALPLFYSYALLSQICCQLFVGGRSYLFHTLRNPLRFEATVNDRGLETFCGVPSTLHALHAFHRLRRLSLPSIRVLCSAGSAMDYGLLPTLKEIFPSATFFDNYGMTEAAPRIAYIRDDDPRFGQSTCGRPIEGVDVRIVDPESNQPVPDGVSGMLIVKGPNVTEGYLNDPELTAQAFTEDGYLISGDTAYRDSGYIYITGRYDDIFKSGGEKIAPLEIERALTALEAIEQAAVVGVRDAQRGMVPVAFVKLRRPIARREVVQFLLERIPKDRLPTRFLEVEKFPLTPNGKLQRRRLTPDDPTFVVGELR